MNNLNGNRIRSWSYNNHVSQQTQHTEESEQLLRSSRKPDLSDNNITHYGSNSSFNQETNGTGENARRIAIGEDQHETLSRKSDKQRRRKFCCLLSGMQCCALTLGILTLIVISAVIGYHFILIPYATALAQDKIDQSHIQVDNMIITDPVGNSLRLYSKSQIKGISGNLPQGTLRAAEFSAIWKGQEFGKMQTPDIHLPAGEESFPLDAVLQVSNSTIFQDFMHAALMDKTAQMFLDGHVDLTVRKFGFNVLTVAVKFHQGLLLQGCNALQGSIVTKFDPILDESLDLAPDRMKGTDLMVKALVEIEFYNPANISMFPLGNLNLTLWYQGVYTGFGLSLNGSISSGLNKMSANVTIVPSADNIVHIAEMLLKHYSNQNVTVELHYGSNATSYFVFNEGLNGLHTALLLPGNKDISVYQEPRKQIFVQEKLKRISSVLQH